MPAMHISPTLAVWAAKIAGKFVAAVLVTDFVSGVFHWFEDAYGREDFPITGNWITRKHILHHHDPRNFVKNSWWQSSWDLALASGLVVAGAWLIGRLSWPVWVFAVIGANA